jgi:putative N6-adenine-specific DNA methylase
MTAPLELIATTAFGLEAVVARELKHLGHAEQRVEDGRVRFTADAAAMCRANIRLRSADRVLMCVGEFEARDFGVLFDQTIELPWEQWLAADAAFPVRGRSIKSQLFSVPDCQRIVKKAIVERLKRAYQRAWFEETGPKYSVEVSLLNDRATLTIDTSGDGLHKRGYRRLVGTAAPLRETLAAALVQFSYWNRERPLADPCCGGGTIPIEAALIGRNIAPGVNRTFAAEDWPQFERSLWRAAREEARRQAQPRLPEPIVATDSDRSAIDLARRHAADAGVAGDIRFQQRPLSEFSTSREYGVVITNPPYGERLGDRREVERLYREMGRVLGPLDTWSIYVLTSHPDFERLFGRRCDRRRKLYNAQIACTYYQFFGPKPPRADEG